MRSKTRELTSLDVPVNLRNQGMGTRLMINVCDEADANGVTLILFPKPYGDVPSMSKYELEEWYASKFGFHTIQNNPIMMARMPFATPGSFKPTFIASAIQGTFK